MTDSEISRIGEGPAVGNGWSCCPPQAPQGRGGRPCTEDDDRAVTRGFASLHPGPLLSRRLAARDRQECRSFQRRNNWRTTVENDKQQKDRKLCFGLTPILSPWWFRGWLRLLQSLCLIRRKLNPSSESCVIFPAPLPGLPPLGVFTQGSASLHPWATIRRRFAAQGSQRAAHGSK